MTERFVFLTAPQESHVGTSDSRCLGVATDTDRPHREHVPTIDFMGAPHPMTRPWPPRPRSGATVGWERAQRPNPCLYLNQSSSQRTQCCATKACSSLGRSGDTPHKYRRRSWSFL